MKSTILKAESKSGFQFTFQIEKSVVKAEDSDLILSGVASTTNVDHDNERMDEGALKRMVNVVNQKGVPLRWEHSKDPNAILGTVFRGHVDERGQMHIDARLDKNHPLAKELYEAVKGGERYGLSVGGKILNAAQEIAEGAGKFVKTFYDILLDEVSVTKKPSNYDAWLKTAVAKSTNKDTSYNRFLFENQQFDYLAQLSKSIPADAWKKVTKLSINTKKNTMNPKDKKDEQVKDEAEKSFVTKAQFDSFSSTVTKALSGIASLMKEMSSSAMDTDNPGKKKEKEVGDEQTAKAREGQEDDGGNGTEQAEGKKDGDEPAKDQVSPDKNKEYPENQQTAKAEDGEEDGEKKNPFAEKAEGEDGEEKEEEESEKAEDGEKEEETDKAEDGEKDEDPTKNLKNAMKSIGDAIGVIDSLTKKMKGIKKIAKSQKTVVKSNISDIDRFAMSVATYCDALHERLEKSHKSIPGFTEALVDQIRNDSSLQGEIQKMMKEPGAKKSVAFGVPYMVTKDGKRFSLTATAVEKVEKSQDGKAVNFKDLYKSKYSAIREAGGQE